MVDVINGAAGLDSTTLSAREAEEDLDLLEAHLVDRWSYMKRKGIDYEAALGLYRRLLAEYREGASARWRPARDRITHILARELRQPALRK